MKCPGKLIFVVLFLFVSCHGETASTREYLKTGNWYPADKHALHVLLDKLFAKSGVEAQGQQIRAMIVPHAGFQYSGRCAAKAYQLLKGREYDRVIILGVAHRVRLNGACVSTFAVNRTPLGDIPVDTDVTRALGKISGFHVDNEIMQYEHSIENQLPFLQYALGSSGFKIVPVLLGTVNRDNLQSISRAIAPFLTARTLVIASSDLTHYGESYGYVPFKNHVSQNLRTLDMGFLARAIALDVRQLFEYQHKTRMTACGTVPIAVLMTLLQHESAKGRLVDYYQSGELTGNFDLSVSYGSIVFEEPTVQKEATRMESPGVELSHISHGDRLLLLKLARETLQSYTDTGKRPALNIEDFPAALHVKRSVFVTLTKHGSLRGCIGNLGEGDPLPISVRDYAISAAAHDPRFPSVTKGELKDIEIEISVMTPMKEIDRYQEIRLGIDGVVIEKGYNRAVYLPQVATETGWDLDQFLGHLCQKAGLPRDAYKGEGMHFYVFQAEVFSEGSEMK